MAMTGFYRTMIRPRTHRPLSMLKYDPVVRKKVLFLEATKGGKAKWYTTLFSFSISSWRLGGSERCIKIRHRRNMDIYTPCMIIGVHSCFESFICAICIGRWMHITQLLFLFHSSLPFLVCCRRYLLFGRTASPGCPSSGRERDWLVSSLVLSRWARRRQYDTGIPNTCLYILVHSHMICGVKIWNQVHLMQTNWIPLTTINLLHGRASSFSHGYQHIYGLLY